MKVCLLASSVSVHTVRWANGLSHAGCAVSLLSHGNPPPELESQVEYCALPGRGNSGYFVAVPSVKRLLRVIRPDILNAHYASGYGTTGRLADFHPWVLSVWGSDVYEFPFRSSFHRWLLRGNLEAADAVASTSHSMVDAIRSISCELAPVHVTPFGVDVDRFQREPTAVLDGEECFTVGTVKSLEDVYGIDLLLRAFASFSARIRSNPSQGRATARLRIVGSGRQEGALKQLARDLGIHHLVDFIGFVPHRLVAREYARMDVFVALSRRESFGVAALEANASGIPVVVADASGLSEIVEHGVTGLVVQREDHEAASDALFLLYCDDRVRVDMGVAGRRRVHERYSWKASVRTMIKVYEDTLSKCPIQ